MQIKVDSVLIIPQLSLSRVLTFPVYDNWLPNLERQCRSYLLTIEARNVYNDIIVQNYYYKCE